MVTEQQFGLRGRPVRAGDDAEIDTLAEVFLGSYDGSLSYGFNADRDTLPDLDRLAALIDPSLQQLVHTAPNRPEPALLRRRQGRDSR